VTDSDSAARPSQLSRIASGPAASPVAALIGLVVCVAGRAIFGPSEAIAWVLVALLPGVALSPFLPVAARRSAASALVAAVIASTAFWVLVIPFLSLLGINLSHTSLAAFLALASLACILLATWWGESATPAGTELKDILGLTAVAVTAFLVAKVPFSNPPLGADWGHYWSFADAIASTGTLDALNTTWMGGGLPYFDYPGVPSLMATWMLQAGVSASATPALISLLFGAGAAAAWLAVRSAWGPEAGVVAGIATALMPAAITTLGWSGLALELSLIFVPPLLAATSVLLTSSGADKRRIQLATAALAIVIVASQPLTAIVLGGAVGVYLLARLAIAKLEGLKTLAGTGVIAIAIGFPVALDYRNRLGSSGVASDYRDFLVTRIDWESTLYAGLLPALLCALGLAGLATTIASNKTRSLAVLALLTTGMAIAYSQLWHLHVAGEYRRAVYLIGPMVAIGLGGLTFLITKQGIALRAAVALVMLAGVAFSIKKWPADLASYYRIVTPTNQLVVEEIGFRAAARNQSILADSCWGFPTLGLTRAKLYTALEPNMIGPQSEVVPARAARLMFRGGRVGEAAIRSYGVRWSLLNPNCATASRLHRRAGVPKGFVTVYADETLIAGYLPETKN